LSNFERGPTLQDSIRVPNFAQRSPVSTPSTLALLPFVLGAAMVDLALTVAIWATVPMRSRGSTAPNFSLLGALFLLMLVAFMQPRLKRTLGTLSSWIVAVVGVAAGAGLLWASDVPVRLGTLASGLAPVAENALALLSSAAILAWPSRRAWEKIRPSSKVTDAEAKAKTAANSPLNRARLRLIAGSTRDFATRLLAVGGTLALIGAHVSNLRDGGSLGHWHMMGTGLLVAAYALTLCTSKHFSGEQRLVLFLVFLPVLVRVALVWPTGLMGAAIPEDLQIWLILAWIVASAGVFLIEWPVVSKLRTAGTGSFAAVSCWALLEYYTRGWGRIESQAGAIVARFIGFVPPYPELVPKWAPPVFLVAIFFSWLMMLSALGTARRRHQGLALAVLGMAGLGLQSPPHVLALFAGLWAHAQWAALDSHGTSLGVGDLSPSFLRLATALSLDEPTMVVDGDRTLGRVGGRIGDYQVDLRFDQLRGRLAFLEVHLGAITRSPLARLFPRSGRTGRRPAHPIAITHAMDGETQLVEALNEDILDHLRELPGAEIQLFAAGALLRVDGFDRPLAIDACEAILRGLARG
jgi:hypothetical protein